VRLDHLLSKEHLRKSLPAVPGRVVPAGDAHSADACSAVGAQGWNISKQFWSVNVLPSVRRPCLSPFGVLVRVPGTAAGEDAGRKRLAHCWVLRPQAPRRPLGGGAGVCVSVSCAGSKVLPVDTGGRRGRDGVVV
jgi:hypothetical protein